VTDSVSRTLCLETLPISANCFWVTQFDTHIDFHIDGAFSGLIQSANDMKQHATRDVASFHFDKQSLTLTPNAIVTIVVHLEAVVEPLVEPAASWRQSREHLVSIESSFSHSIDIRQRCLERSSAPSV
jgi:hypothetical protein